MEFNLINHDDLTMQQLRQIAGVKAQHWVHPIDSQIKWIQETYKPCDAHIVLMDGDTVVGYVGVALINIVADGKPLDIYGISCLCVDKQYLGKGYGLVLMERALKFAKDNGKNICLLCKEKLVKFYEKCGYTVFAPESISVEQEDYEHIFMVYDASGSRDFEALKIARNMAIDRNF